MDNIMRTFSPFNLNLELEREKSQGVVSFLPSYHEHKLNLFKSPGNPGLVKLMDDKDEYDRKGLKRSGTALLRKIKDPASKKVS